jgi:hypothetical protein
MVQDEVAGWIEGFERYSSGSSRPFYLQAWNGSTFTKDRVGKGKDDLSAEICVDNLALSILGGIQPDKLTKIGDLTDDGLLQRFLAVLMKSAGLPDTDTPVAVGSRGYEYFITHNGNEAIYWQGMTEAGLEAFRSVLRNRRVAVQYVSRLLYIVDGVEVDADAWEPIALLPVRAANLDTPKWAIRASPAPRAKALGIDPSVFRPLTPLPVRATADDFCTW